MAGRRIEIRGTVQGVGFRPWVYRVAQRKGSPGGCETRPLASRSRRSASDGAARAFSRAITEDYAFVSEGRRAARESDSRASCSTVSSSSRATPLATRHCRSHRTSRPAASASGGPRPADRRYRYAFTNCTSCGPRFTIATGIPYDRPRRRCRNSRCVRSASRSMATSKTDAFMLNPTRARSADRS